MSEQKFPTLLRCMTCGSEKDLTISCNICELRWCSDVCRFMYDERHMFVCVSLYPPEKGTKNLLVKRFALDHPALPTINGVKYYTLPGPIEGDIPFFVIDKKRDSKLFGEWKSMVISTNGINGGCPENWYYILDTDRVPQLMFYHLSKQQVGQFSQLMENAARIAFGN